MASGVTFARSLSVPAILIITLTFIQRMEIMTKMEKQDKQSLMNSIFYIIVVLALILLFIYVIGDYVSFFKSTWVNSTGKNFSEIILSNNTVA